MRLILPAALAIALTTATPALADDPAVPTPDQGFGSILFSRCLALATYGATGNDKICQALGQVLAGGSLPTSPPALGSNLPDLAPTPAEPEPPSPSLGSNLPSPGQPLD